jgi:serine/threonine protein kinase
MQSPYILKVRYLDKELFVDTTQTEETEFPVLLMDWVEGQTLSSFLQNIANNYDEDYSFWSEEEEKTALFELKCLPYNFIRAASWLIKQPFAHGDIKPDNIIIKPDGTCVLVDYDGMYVPAMQGMKIQCMGTPNFRYPLIDQRFDKSLDNYSIAIIALSLRAFALEPERISECDDFCIITEKETSKLHEHRLFKDEVMMSDNLFRDLLAIYLHTLSQNKLNPDFFDSCISEYLCPDNYDISSTKVSDSEKEDYWEDIYGVRYSLDGRKVISTSKGLTGVDYTIREGVLTVCDQAFQSRGLHSITLPESVVSIGDRAFANNDDMEYCNIPSSVRFIYDNNPWGGCFNIKKLDCKSSYYIIRDYNCSS